MYPDFLVTSSDIISKGTLNIVLDC